LENLGFAVGAADLCAAGVSAPHPRQRLYWMGVADEDRRKPRSETAAPMGYGRSADTTGRADSSGLVNANGYHEHWWSGPVQVGRNGCETELERGGRKYRAQWRLKPGLSIVAHGISNRVGKLCGFGNAIVPQLAAEFIGACAEVI
jgi:DNA (cytosine-5)-methyltransferase 1